MMTEIQVCTLYRIFIITLSLFCKTMVQFGSYTQILLLQHRLWVTVWQPIWRNTSPCLQQFALLMIYSLLPHLLLPYVLSLFDIYPPRLDVGCWYDSSRCQISLWDEGKIKSTLEIP